MASAKSSDLAILREFLDRERHRYEALNGLHEAIGRIDSIAAAEIEVKQALESTQADLAWARVEFEAVQADLNLARKQYAEEIALLEAGAGAKRQEAKKMAEKLEAARAATAIIVNSLLKAGDDTGQGST